MRPAPFFEAPGGSSVQRRLLLVSWSFPPDSNIGALRWQKFIELAGGRGWGADVVMMDPSEATVRDESRLSGLPPGTRLFGVPLPEHAWLARERRLRGLLRSLRGATGSRPGDSAQRKATGWAAASGANGSAVTGSVRALRRSYLAWLHYDQWSDWSSRAAALGVQLARERSYGVVVSSGPPQMAHEAARRIAVAVDLPLVLDFRDPWTAAESAPRDLSGAVWRRLSASHERRCLEQASLVAVTTAAIARDLTAAYPWIESRLITVMNGADPDVGPVGPGVERRRFTIAQAGGLYGGRDPRHLFRAVGELARERGLTPEKLGVHFIGSTDYEGRSLMQIAEEEGIAPFLISEPARPRGEALRVLQQAAVLVLLPQELHHCIPGKTFEYVQFAAWILAIAAPGSATELLLRDTGALVVGPGDTSGITRGLARCYDAFERGERPTPINSDGRFDRAQQAERLFEALQHLVARDRLPM